MDRILTLGAQWQAWRSHFWSWVGDWLPTLGSQWRAWSSYFGSWVKDWTPANWIASGAAALSLGLGIYNTHAATVRERAKNRREEFRSRVATPIETSLSEFDKSADLLLDLYDEAGPVNVAALDEVELSAQKAQRKLSRALRAAASSRMCGDLNWAVAGNDKYDFFIGLLEEIRALGVQPPREKCKEAAACIESMQMEIRGLIETELEKYV